MDNQKPTGTLHIIGLVAGILVGTGIFISRVALAETASEMVTAGALTLFEFAGVLTVEAGARKVRSQMDQWLRLDADARASHAKINAARLDLERWEAHLKEIERKRTEHHAHLEERAVLSASNDRVRDACVHAALDGYSAGIAANKGRLLGA